MRLQVNGHAVQVVVDKVLDAQVLDGAQAAVVLPVHGDLELPRPVQVDGEPLVPGLLRARLPASLRNRVVVEPKHGHDLIGGVRAAHRVGLGAAHDAAHLKRLRRLLQASRDREGVALLAIRHILQQALAAHETNLELAGDGRGSRHLAQLAARLGRRLVVGLARQRLEDPLPGQVEQRDALETLADLVLRLLQRLLLCLVHLQDVHGVLGALAHRRLNVQSVAQLFDPDLHWHQHLQLVC